MEVKNEFEISEKDLKKFNWGAFILGWIWGLLNKSYITLIQLPIILIPVVGTFLSLGLSIWFGIKGNSWAYKNKHFNNFEEFISKQKKYTIAGILIILINIIAMAISLPFFHKLISMQVADTLSIDVYSANIAHYSLKIISNINISLMLLLLVWVTEFKKSLKVIISSLIILATFYLTLIPALECYAEKLVSKTIYDSSIKIYEKLIPITNFYPHIKKEKNFSYKNKIVFLYLIKNDLNKAINWAELAENDHVVYPIEENQLTSLYIFNGDYEKAINRGAKYKICLTEKNWSCAINELTPKINNPKDGKMYENKVYANEYYYLARAIAYKNLGKNDLADKDFKIASTLNKSPDIAEAYKNYKTYYNKPEMFE